MSFKIKFYADPGHGWGAVKRNLVYSLGVAGKISPCSYQKGDTVYLEEDCDLSIVVDALRAAGHAVEFETKHTDNRSPIRSYDRFVA